MKSLHYSLGFCSNCQQPETTTVVAFCHPLGLSLNRGPLLTIISHLLLLPTVWQRYWNLGFFITSSYEEKILVSSLLRRETKRQRLLCHTMKRSRSQSLLHDVNEGRRWLEMEHSWKRNPEGGRTLSSSVVDNCCKNARKNFDFSNLGWVKWGKIVSFKTWWG